MYVDPTQLLPNELLAECLGCADIETVLCASHVCVRWRAMARASPIFWRTIRLAATSNTALDFFRARITHTDTPGISIQISMPVPSQGVRHRLALASVTIRFELEKHLRRIASLSIAAPRPDMRFIATALANQADILARLFLRIPPDEDTTEDKALMYDIQWVPMHAPQLHVIGLLNISVPLKAPIRWFTAATTVKLIYNRHCTVKMPTDIFHRFTSCQDIEIKVHPLARLSLEYPDHTIQPRPTLQPHHTRHRCSHRRLDRVDTACINHSGD